MIGKKGISPLVATVLLVAFSVALGALVMSWGQDYIAEKAAFVQGKEEVKTGCDLASLNIINIGGVPQICIKDSNQIQVWFDNGPDMDISNINAKIIGNEGINVNEGILKTPLLKENAVKTEFYFENIGDILQVKFTPKVYLIDRTYFCSGQTIEVEDIPSC